MGFNLFFISVLALLPLIFAHDIKRAMIIVNANRTISETDDYFICATLDWWPHDKCNYNQCPWVYSSVINLDLSQPLLAKAIQAFKPLRIRIGGSLQDQVIYDVGNLETPCHPFRKMEGGLFGFSKGCLHMKRWDELNDFLSRTGAVVTFGLNALRGRHKIGGIAWEGDWNSTNARDFINYTVSKGYQIDSWELGNELSGNGVGASVNAELYGKDLIKLKEIINDLYRNSPSKPLLVAPGGFYDQEWFSKFLQVSGPGVVDVVTHHVYNLGAGNDPKLVEKILNPDYLSRSILATFKNLNQTIQRHGPWASAWVGEAGGAYNSGGRHVSDTFVDSFWYLDQLGMSSRRNTKVYCRQSLVGGNYGLLAQKTFVPNPDYYGALLWHRLMGKAVLEVHSDASPFLRAYAHCSKTRAGITLLLINLSKQTAFAITVGNGMNLNTNLETNKESFMDNLKTRVSWVGNRASDGYSFREEYHLTPKDGDLKSQTMVLNGKPLELTVDGDMPKLEPVLLNVKSPINVAPRSISFVVVPNFDGPACA